MKARRLAAMVWVATSFPAASQGASTPVEVPAEVKPFVEQGSKPVALEKADLNRDQREDWLLVLEHAKPRINPGDKYEERGPRSLLLLVRDANNALRVAARNDYVVYCRDCGGVMGDPFQGIEAHAGRFTVLNAGGSRYRWSFTYTFSWSHIDSAWQLVRTEETNLDIYDPKQRENLIVRRPPKDYGKIDFRTYKPKI